MNDDELRRKRIRLLDFGGTRAGPSSPDNSNWSFMRPQKKKGSSLPTSFHSNYPTPAIFPADVNPAEPLSMRHHSASLSGSQIIVPRMLPGNSSSSQYQTPASTTDELSFNGYFANKSAADSTEEDHLVRQMQQDWIQQNNHGVTSSPSFLATPSEGSASDAQQTPGQAAKKHGPIFPPWNGSFFKAKGKSLQKKLMLIGTETTGGIGEVLDASHDAKAVRNFVKTLKFTCTRCGEGSNDSLSEHVNTLVHDLKSSCDSLEPVRLDATYLCLNCSAVFCLGCGECVAPLVIHGNCNDNWTSDLPGGILVSWHCDRGRLASILLLLCTYDTLNVQYKPKGQAPAKQQIKKTRRNRKGSQPAGIGFSIDDMESDGWMAAAIASHGHQDPFGEYEEECSYICEPPPSRSESRPKSVEKRLVVLPELEDLIPAKIMEALTYTLPSMEGPRAPTAFDFEPPTTLPALLLRSSILDRAAELLRNDSIDYAISHFDVYDRLLSLVRRLGSHHATSATVFAPRPVNRKGHNLLQVSIEKATKMRDEGNEQSQPVVICLRSLATQCKLMLERASKANAKDFETDDSQRMLAFCHKLVDLAEHFQANGLSLDGTESKDKILGTQQDLALCEVPDDILFSAHYFATDARQMTEAPAGRMRKLIQELTILKTSLPPGIFVRHGSSRLDLMKILIVGPQDTPYENGLFEFDLFCPSNYPQQPPQMLFRTTGGGGVSFNPNLYPCGKVCLSLLGTWSGEKWRPGQSTILQVLVSLQAMVLCDEPHCNEPACDSDRGSKQSKAYNRRLYPLTVKHAMLEWLESTAERPPPRRVFVPSPPSHLAAGLLGGSNLPPGNLPPGNLPPGNLPPGNFLPDNLSPGYLPPGNFPLGYLAPSDLPPGYHSQPPPSPPPPPPPPSSSLPAYSVAPPQVSNPAYLNIPQLEQRPKIWDDVVQNHFAANEEAIMATVTKWAKKRPYKDTKFKMIHPPTIHSSDLQTKAQKQTTEKGEAREGLIHGLRDALGELQNGVSKDMW